MYHEIVDLYSYFNLPRCGASGGYLSTYVQKPFTEIPPRIRPAMLVIPGGGYQMVSEREGEPIATCFFRAGFACFVVEYTVNRAYPVPLVEAAMAMAYIRREAKRYKVDGEHVAAVGFSAGGHLVGMLATLFDDVHVREALKENASLVRPDAVILSYPVITTGIKTHGGSADTISGGNEALRKSLSLETRVTKESSPAFIWHTVEDDCVPVENALLMAEAYKKAGVPFEMHTFEWGWHGLSDVSEETAGGEIPPRVMRNAAWIELAVSWLKHRGFEADGGYKKK